ncbi:ADP-ribose pyrophosphatase [Thermotomaculum hydrothermale]|uniref:ADP-ribose pyrophosphatase n=1 Tax=Thermotomaculum hydrothermale TaxID=981385 RepID=A0A7R6PY19_9BACT|nr:hypothetical protein [Thermotomaculum hydrothermale]BBB32900.1 ADP-ribose pyrophosphatase [Thermotomaculum hydrothermale]
MKEIKELKVLNHKICSQFENPFFVHHKYRLQNVYEDNSVSREYNIEFFDRKGYDCVAVIPFYRENENVYVGILKAFRPTIYFRKNYPLPLKDNRIYTFVYESVAGSLEEHDRGLEGVLNRAIEELKEEAGFIVSKDDVFSLGGSFFPSHGQSTEKIHLFAADISNAKKVEAMGDGSVNEELNQLVFFELYEIKDLCFKGIIEDPKIEIGVGRLERCLLTEKGM